MAEKFKMNKYFGVKDSKGEKVILGSLLICPSHKPETYGYGPYEIYWDEYSSSYNMKNINNQDSYPILTYRRQNGDLVLSQDYLVITK